MRNLSLLFALSILLSGCESLSAFFSSTAIDATPLRTPSVAEMLPVALPTPPIVVTVVRNASSFPFALENGQIEYGFTETTNCQYAFAGLIRVSAPDVSVDDFRIHIKILVDNVPDSEDDVVPVRLSSTTFGWSGVVLNWRTDYEVWLSSGERDLSPHITVETKGCETNLAIVNFAQVAPLE